MQPDINDLRDHPGIHSIGEFSLTVPSIDEAFAFYSAFGLDVRSSNLHLDLYAADGYRWGRIVQGDRKCLRHLTLHCYADDFAALQRNLDALECNQLSAPAWSDPVVDGARSLWLRDPDGLLVQLRVGSKTSPHAVQRVTPTRYVDGVRAARYRRQMEPVKPQRLSHLARLTADVDGLVDFYARAFGLRLSDRSGNHVAFMHGRHGSDHHLLAFASSTGAALHHLSWDVPTIEEVGLGAMNMVAHGYEKGWGLGRHVLGSNYFYYVEDPWGSFCEYSSGMDFIPAQIDWQALDHPPEDAFFLWGPEVPPQMLVNSEAD